MLSELLSTTSSPFSFNFCEEFMKTLRMASHRSLEEKLTKNKEKKKSRKTKKSAVKNSRDAFSDFTHTKAAFPKKNPKKDQTLDDKVKNKKEAKKYPIAIPFVLHDKFLHGNYSASYTFDPRYQELFSYQGGNLKFGQSYYDHIHGKTKHTHVYHSDPLISNAQIEKILKKKHMEEVTKTGRLYTNNEMPWMGTADDQAFNFYKMASWNFIWNRVKYMMMQQGLS